MKNPEHIQHVHDLGVKLAKRMNNADFLVVTHTDSVGGHLHNHIYVVNHDNLTGKSLSRCRSWSRGLGQVNDELMCDEGCHVLPAPQQPKSDWDLRRGGFVEGGFEQVLGDKVMESLLDPRSVDREAFEQVLAEHEVRLRVTDRDGWTYSMRRADNGKWGRRKASSLCDEFTAKGIEEVFAFHQQCMNNTQKGEQHERSGKAQAGAASLGDINILDVKLDAVEKQTRELTKAVNTVSGFLRAMDEAQTAALTRVEKSTSQQHEQPSQTQFDDETKSRLSEIEKTLAVVAKQLSASGAVKLPDGSIVKRSDVDAYLMMQSLQCRLETTTTALSELKHVVGNGRTVRVDIDRLNDYTVRLLDQRLSQAVEAPVKRVESTLEGFEHRVSSLGADKISEAAQRLDQTPAKAEDVVATVSRTERHLKALEGHLTWTTVGRICLALVPLAMVLVILGGLTMGAFYALGFGPLLGWAWASFEAASSWWAKGVIALATLSGVAGFAAVVRRLGERLREEFGTW